MVVVEGVVDLLAEPGADLGLVAVADGLEQQVLEALPLEHLAEDVEDAALEGLALDFAAFRAGGDRHRPRGFPWRRGSRGGRPPVWPMRWMRPKRCSRRFGFHGRS